MLFALAGEAGGHILAKEQISYYKEMKEKQKAGLDVLADEQESDAEKLKKGITSIYYHHPLIINFILKAKSQRNQRRRASSKSKTKK